MSGRLVGGCVPVRVSSDGAHSVLVVKSSKVQGRWLFPKGGVKKPEKAKEAAVRESFEEAGVKGELVLPKIGEWKVKKETHKMWILKVTEESDVYDEPEREKKWLSFLNAKKLFMDMKAGGDKRATILLEILDSAQQKI